MWAAERHSRNHTPAHAMINLCNCGSIESPAMASNIKSPKTEQYKQWLSSLTEAAVEKAMELSKELCDEARHSFSLPGKWILDNEERLVISSRIQTLLLQWKPDLSAEWKKKVRQSMPVLEQAFYLQCENREEYANLLLLDLQLKKLLSHFQAGNGHLLLQNKSPVHPLSKTYYHYCLSCTSFDGHGDLQDPVDWARANLPPRGSTVATLMSSELTQELRLDEIAEIDNRETLDQRNCGSETLTPETPAQRYGRDFAVLKKIIDLLAVKRRKVGKKKMMMVVQDSSYSDIESQIESQKQGTNSARTRKPGRNTGKSNLLAILASSCSRGGAASPMEALCPLPRAPITDQLGFSEQDNLRSSSSCCPTQLAQDADLTFTEDTNHVKFQTETSLSNSVKKKKMNKNTTQTGLMSEATEFQQSFQSCHGSEAAEFRQTCHGDQCNRDFDHKSTVKNDHVIDLAGMLVSETHGKHDKTVCCYNGDKNQSKSLLSCLLEESSNRDASDSRNTLHQSSSSSLGHGFSISTSCRLSSISCSSYGDLSDDDKEVILVHCNSSFGCGNNHVSIDEDVDSAMSINVSEKFKSRNGIMLPLPLVSQICSSDEMDAVSEKCTNPIEIIQSAAPESSESDQCGNNKEISESLSLIDNGEINVALDRCIGGDESLSLNQFHHEPMQESPPKSDTSMLTKLHEPVAIYSASNYTNVDKIGLGINVASMSFTSDNSNSGQVTSSANQIECFKELSNCKNTVGESSRRGEPSKPSSDAPEKANWLTNASNGDRKEILCNDESCRGQLSVPKTQTKSRTPLSSFLVDREEWDLGCPSDIWLGVCPWDSWEEPASAIDPMCCVCMVGLKGAAFTPCGHTFCRKCARELWKGRQTCPLCNSIITGILDIY